MSISTMSLSPIDLIKDASRISAFMVYNVTWIFSLKDFLVFSADTRSSFPGLACECKRFHSLRVHVQLIAAYGRP